MQWQRYVSAQQARSCMRIFPARWTTMRPRACASSWTMRWSAALGTTLQIQHAPAQLRRVLQLAGIRCTDAPKTEE